MKIKLLGKNLGDIRPLLNELGFEEVERGFELIVTHGGDGALLGAEREFPGVPKLLLRGHADVAEIAFRVGFADQNYFARMFKQQYRITPLEYRRTFR